MKKIIKNLVFLTAFCLLGFVIKAAIVLPDGSILTQDEDEITAACGKGNGLRRVDCGFKTPVYACRHDGTAEDCVQYLDCPSSGPILEY